MPGQGVNLIVRTTYGELRRLGLHSLLNENHFQASTTGAIDAVFHSAVGSRSGVEGVSCGDNDVYCTSITVGSQAALLAVLSSAETAGVSTAHSTAPSTGVVPEYAINRARALRQQGKVAVFLALNGSFAGKIFFSKLNVTFLYSPRLINKAIPTPY